ncbi:MAG: hypothetical protein MUF16_29005, partial [Burkholderiaceae bacterium]|nr:hypothetical protein [Burkholderiaceae bacterium]
MVLRLHAQTAAAQAGRRQPGGRKLDLALQIHVAAAHTVRFVAAQAAGDAEHLVGAAADEVLVAAPVLALPLGGHAGNQRGMVPAPDQSRVEPGVVAAQIDDAAGVARIGLRGRRNGLPLRHVALAGVGGEHALAQGAEVGKPMPPGGAALRLPGGLAGVEQRGLRCRLVRVGVELRTRQAQRILRRLIHAVQQQRQRVLFADPAQPQVAQRALRRAVRTHAVGVELAGHRADVP